MTLTLIVAQIILGILWAAGMTVGWSLWLLFSPVIVLGVLFILVMFTSLGLAVVIMLARRKAARIRGRKTRWTA